LLDVHEPLPVGQVLAVEEGRESLRRQVVLGTSFFLITPREVGGEQECPQQSAESEACFHGDPPGMESTRGVRATGIMDRRNEVKCKRKSNWRVNRIGWPRGLAVRRLPG